MKKMKKIALLSAAVLSISGVGALSLTSASANTDYSGFKIMGTEIREGDITGIRFRTEVPDSLKSDYTFGTLIMPRLDLGENELTVDTKIAIEGSEDFKTPVDVVTEYWQNANQYTSVLIGVTKADGTLTGIPKSKYNADIVARSYIKDKDGNVVYYTAETETTVAYIASKALLYVDSAYMKEICDYVLGADGFAFTETSKTLTEKVSINVEDLFAADNGAEGMVAKWEVTGSAVTLADGVITPVAAGTSTVKATIGSYSQEITYTVEEAAVGAVSNVTLDEATGVLSWTAADGAASYDVKVTSWNTNGGVVYESNVTGTSIDLNGEEAELCGIYNVSINGVGAFGTDGDVTTQEIATYTPAEFNTDEDKDGVKTLFTFEDEGIMAWTKPSTWYQWSDPEPISEAEISYAEAFEGQNAVKVIASTSGTFAGIAIKLPEAIPFDEIGVFSLDYYNPKANARDIDIVLSDGTNSAYKVWSAGQDEWRTDVAIAKADFIMMGTLTTVTEIYITGYNGVGVWYFDNIRYIPSSIGKIAYSAVEETISWSAAANATEYEVAVNGTIIDTVTTTSIEQALASGNNNVKVVAKDSDGNVVAESTQLVAGLTFNQVKNDNVYYLADFTNVNDYASYISKSGTGDYSLEEGNLQIKGTGAWSENYVKYSFPYGISKNSISIIKITMALGTTSENITSFTDSELVNFLLMDDTGATQNLNNTAFTLSTSSISGYTDVVIDMSKVTLTGSISGVGFRSLSAYARLWNVKEITCVKYPALFNELKSGTTNEYYLADFSKADYAAYINSLGSATYVAQDNYLQVNPTGGWNDNYVKYSLPKAIAKSTVSTIKILIDININNDELIKDGGYVYVQVFDESSNTSVHCNGMGVASEIEGLAVITIDVSAITSLTGETFTAFGFRSLSGYNFTWGVYEITYTTVTE